MKVKELIKMLKDFDQNLEIYMSGDEEGNDFSPFSGDFSIMYNDIVNNEILCEEDKCDYLEENSDVSAKELEEILVLWP